MRGDLVAALIFAGIAGAEVITAMRTGSPGDWAPAVFLVVIGLFDARRVWRALSQWEQLRGRL